ncbi:MAG TPA: MATE family efflux transporter [Candidatus Limiplasma sp.]|nr:MATE family efflux transporter [Candidatus Limiplasma sp.]
MASISAKLKGFFAPMDMTEGNSLKQIIRFSIPLLIGNFAQQMYSTVDAIVVGNYIGDNALGAVGLSFPIIMLIYALFIGVGTGAGITVSQFFGAKNRQMLDKAVGTIILLALLAGVACTVLGVAISRPLLTVLGSPDEMLEMATTYLTIYFAGILSVVYFNILCGVLRGLGDSVSPLIYLFIASALNIALDILFVTRFKMTTDGVALATVISQTLTAVLAYRKLTRMKNTLTVSRATMKLDREIVSKIFKLGLPVGATQAIFSLQAILVQSLMNSMGPMVVTVYTAVMRVDGFIMMPNFTFAAAATTFTAQNYGAKKLSRIRQGHRDTLKAALTCAMILMVCILLFGRQLMGVFTSTEAVVALGARMLRILAAGYVAFAVLQTFVGVMQGMNQTTIPMIMSVFTALGVRLPLAYLLAFLTRSDLWPNGNPDALYVSQLSAWLFNTAVTCAIFKWGKWRKRAESILETD